MGINKTSWWFTIFVLFMCFSLRSHRSLGADRISANHSLCGNQTIVSAGGVFELGFFKQGKTPDYYVGIWYNKVSTQTIVWVANREKPVTDKYSSELRISFGNLVLFDGSKSAVWSTNLSSSNSSSIEAVILDEGNLVLRDGSSVSEPLWQSFYHPTDTWLPGAKLGLNKVTGENTRLISWKNKEDPAQGLFSYELDLNEISQYVALFNMSKKYWKSGRWNGQTFDQVPEMRRDFIFNYSFVDNSKESYFTYSLYNSSLASRFVMDVRGQIQQYSWLESAQEWSLFWSQPISQCDVYAGCGTFGSCTMKSQPFCHCLVGFVPKFVDDWNSGVYSGGCVRKTSLQCGNSSLIIGESDKFLASYNMVLPENPETVAVVSSQECESNCSSNCACTAYAYDNNQCSVWIGDLLNLRFANDTTGGITLHVMLAASELSKSNNNKGIVFGGVAGSGVTVLALIGVVLFVIFRRNRAIKEGKEAGGLLKAFGYRYLQNATKNFSEKLGEGGFGSVFKGMLPDSSMVAVKKLESISQGDKQFRMEVSTIGTIQHINLVRLRGFCSEGTRKLLVYEYMPNGSLDSFLFRKKGSNILNWKTRYNVALGTASGLAYLHEKCRDCIVHCDVKPENILLDIEFFPKLADFGMAKLFGRDFSKVLTSLRGTIGYLAPEWISGEAITAKVDVYSYGMMLMELVSGRRNSEQSKDGKMEYFPIRVAGLVNKDGDVLSLLDPFLEGNANVEELTRICKVACWCIQDDKTLRPSMSDVVYILEGSLGVNLPPIPRLLEKFSWKPGELSP